MRQGKNKNKIYSRFDIGRVPVTSVDVAKPETAQQFRERLAKEEEARINAPIKAAEQQLAATLRQMTEELAQTWRLPLDKLQRFDRNYADALHVELSLPKENQDANPEALMQSVKAEFKTFVDNLPSKGYVFNNSVRFQSFIQTQIVFGGVKIDQSSLATMFAWLVNHECFSESELRYVPELVPPTEAEPEPEVQPLTLSEALMVAEGDRDKLLRDAVEFDWLNAHRSMIEVWTASLARDWNIYPSPADWKFLFDKHTGYFVQRNLQFTPANLDKARVMMSRTRRWLQAETAQEVYDRLLVAGTVSYANYVGRFNQLGTKWTRPCRESGISAYAND